VDSAGRARDDWNARPFPSVPRVAAEMLFLGRLSLLRLRRSRARREVDQPAGACLMVRRSALESLQGFDERFFPAWFEDVDLCRRIRLCGGRILLEPRAEFRHAGGYSLGHLSREEFLRYFHTNQIRYFEKHHGPAVAARVRRLIAAGMLLRAGVASLSPRFGPSRIYWRLARRFWQLPRNER
jgi:GT2 family glycosyltransferase